MQTCARLVLTLLPFAAAHRVIDRNGAMTFTAPDPACVIKGRQ